MNKNKIIDFLKLFAFVVCFAGIPLTMVCLGYYYSVKQYKEALVKDLHRDVSAFYTKLTLSSDPEKFWCYLFYNKINSKINVYSNDYFVLRAVIEKVKGYLLNYIPNRNNKTFINYIPNKLFSFYINLANSNIAPIISVLFPQPINNSQEIPLIILDNILFELNKSYDFDYIVYCPDCDVRGKLNPGVIGGTLSEQKLAYQTIWNCKRFGFSIPITEEVEKLLGKIFGPQFYINHLDVDETDNTGLKLCWTDSLYKRRVLWSNVNQGCLTLVFLKPELINDIESIKTYLNSINDELNYNLVFSIKNDETKTFLHSDYCNEIEKKEIENASLIYEKDRSMKIETEHFFVFPKFLRAGVTVYGAFRKSDSKYSKTFLSWIIWIIVTALGALYIFIYAWKIIILKKLDNVSIRWKLVFLFFFANGLPLLVLIYLGNNFLGQARSDYIQKIMTEGTAFLQDFDEKYKLEYAKSLIRKEKIKKGIINKRKHSLITKSDVDYLYQSISSDTAALFVIASSGKTLIRNFDGIYDDNDMNKPHFKKGKRGKVNKHLDAQIEFSQKLGNFVLSQLNNKPIQANKATEIELIIESTLRKNLNSFIFELIGKLGTFMSIGFGKNIHPGLLDTISLYGNNCYDYFVFATIRTKDFQRNYLEKNITQANRNELGIRVITWNNENYFIPAYEQSAVLDDFRKRLTAFPVEDAIILKHNDKDYIAMGFECKHMERCKLIGLYPLDLINEHVALRRNELIAISLLSFLMTIFLSTLIVKSFLTPLSEITLGAKSIEAKNFEYRLPKLGRDEFGDMGKIFNNVIVDLEELSVAGAIQEQLLPNQSIKTGYFSLYGKSVAMGALGGDYYDFIEMEDNKFSVALGDVAGHGVGASLIMAMAKAGLVSLESLWKDPQKLLLKLHEMVYKSKTQKQRKIMTFQYMYLDGNTGQASYSNAGGCSPIIVRKSNNSVEHLKLNGAVLGAFKRGKFLETNLQFESGDAIVFYTDGIVECKDANGTMLGYDNLKVMIQKCWNEDAEIFYKNIYKNYLDYIGGNEADAGDDVTIVVLVYNKPSDSSDPSDSDENESINDIKTNN